MFLILCTLLSYFFGYFEKTFRRFNFFKSEKKNIVQRYGLKNELRFALPKYQGQGQFDEMTPITGVGFKMFLDNLKDVIQYY